MQTSDNSQGTDYQTLAARHASALFPDGPGNADPPGEAEARRLRESQGKLKLSVIEAYRSEHKELLETWKIIDTKAQGIAAFATFIAAGSITIINGFNASSSVIERVALAFALCGLLITIVYGLLCLNVKMTLVPPTGDQISEQARDILRSQDATGREEVLVASYDNQIALWRAAVMSLKSKLADKSGKLISAQGWLSFTTIVYIAFAIGLSLFKAAEKLDGAVEDRSNPPAQGSKR